MRFDSVPMPSMASVDRIAALEQAPVLDAAAAGQRAGAEQLARIELLAAAGVRQHLAERPARIRRRAFATIARR